MTSLDNKACSISRISIITPCLNRVQYISAAIESVLLQNYPDFEHIIVDGGSTDGTLDLLKNYRHLEIISGRDRGMYDALNKGLRMASGDVIGFLNSDDLYAAHAFSAVLNAFSELPVDFVSGKVEIFANESQQATRIFGGNMLVNLLEKSIVGEMPFNGFFFRKTVFDLLGIFDSEFSIIGDREFMMRLALAKLPGFESPQVLYRYREHLGSMTFGLNDQKLQAIVDNELLWIEKFSRKPRFSSEANVYLCELITRDTIRVCGHCVRERDLAGALFYMREGLRYNPFWFYRFFKHALLHPMRQKLGLPYRTP